MNYSIELDYIGDINLSGKVIVSNPYTIRSLHSLKKEITVKPGKYQTFIITRIVDGNSRVASVIVIHKDCTKPTHPKWGWTFDDERIKTDSGQCGILDNTVYSSGEKQMAELHDECWGLTVSGVRSRILKHHNGVVLRTGCGDGEYNLLRKCQGGYCIGLMLDFTLLHTIALSQILCDYLTSCNLE